MIPKLTKLTLQLAGERGGGKLRYRHNVHA